MQSKSKNTASKQSVLKTSEFLIQILKTYLNEKASKTFLFEVLAIAE